MSGAPRMSRTFVTGIEGFAGLHLCAALDRAGHEVSGLHLAPVPADLPARLLQGDIRDFDLLKQALEEVRPDAVIHLAAVSSVAESENQLLGTFDINASGTLKLLEAVRGTVPKARILLVSSADVYGQPESEAPRTEESPANPLSAYAMTKLAAEEIGRFFQRVHGLDIVILRPFSHTGPGQNPKFVFPSVARRIVEIERAAENTPALADEERTIELGNVDVRRDYTDVRDICQAYLLALERCRCGETYNVTSGRTISIRQGVEMLIKMAKTQVSYRSVPRKLRPHDILLSAGSDKKFKAATGWNPLIPLETTFSDLLNSYRQVR